MSTTRRSFFGKLLGAVVAAPAIAKACAERGERKPLRFDKRPARIPLYVTFYAGELGAIRFIKPTENPVMPYGAHNK